MIIPYKESVPLTEEQKENLYWDDWVFNSHKWEEYSPGYYKCFFCEKIHTSTMPVQLNLSLCNGNPRIFEEFKNKYYENFL